MVTVVTGRAAAAHDADVTATIAEHLRAEHPEVELVCYSGEQTDTLLLMGVE